MNEYKNSICADCGHIGGGYYDECENCTPECVKLAKEKWQKKRAEGNATFEQEHGNECIEYTKRLEALAQMRYDMIESISSEAKMEYTRLFEMYAPPRIRKTITK